MVEEGERKHLCDFLEPPFVFVSRSFNVAWHLLGVFRRRTKLEEDDDEVEVDGERERRNEQEKTEGKRTYVKLLLAAPDAMHIRLAEEEKKTRKNGVKEKLP